MAARLPCSTPAQCYNEAMSEPTYTPDESDQDWLKGLSHEPLNPDHPDYEARMKWRHEQTLKKQGEAKGRTTIIHIEMDENARKVVLVVLIILAIAGAIFWLANTKLSDDSTDQTDGPSSCYAWGC